ncbi:MAG TPA: HEPN-associated N-terminal domain-containing protein [Allosphingosinicella sp.]|jgi:hypothetical protein
MGRAKEWQLEQWERGYYEAEGDICANCVSDPALKQWVTDNTAADACTFCGEESDEPIAASFDEFVGVVMTGVRFDWNHPDDEGIMYVSADGGYQASVTDTWDVLADYDISEDTDVVEAIINVVENDGWVEREYYIGDKSQRLEWGWDRFKQVVKHQTRYVFLAPDEDDGLAEVPPSRMLAAIGETVIDELADLNLIKEIDVATDLFRVRVGDEPFHTGADIGTPPAQYANQANRMSPAGIAMFYGAFDVDTARAETLDPQHDGEQTLSIGTFRSTRSLRVLDLADLPDIPSIFEEDGHPRIHPLRFLHAFAQDIVQPIVRDGREHIEYVPTQIVTEYFRRVFRDAGGKPIDGIVYESSRHAGGRAFVLFCENEQCFKSDEGLPFVEQLVELCSVVYEQA